jgi:hypothetical protein
MGSVDWNGNEIANALDLGLDLDLTCSATFAAEPRNGSGPKGPTGFPGS